MKDERQMRLGMYRKIEVARRQIGLLADEDAFREFLWENFRMRSRKDMNIHQLSRLVQLLAQKGAVYTAPAKSRGAAVKPHSRPDWIEITDSMDWASQKRQILAIWRKLGYSMSSLDKRVERAFGVKFFVWLNDFQQVKALLTDLQARERSFDRKQAARAAEASAMAAGGGVQ